MNPKEFNLYVKAHEDRVKEQDTLNWILGKYIAIAVNNPKKYPESPLLRRGESSENTAMSGEEMEERIRRLNKMLGGKENGT